MVYEQTKVKNNVIPAEKKLAEQALDARSTAWIVWYMLKRHNKALWITAAITFFILWLFPQLPSVIVNILSA